MVLSWRWPLSCAGRRTASSRPPGALLPGACVPLRFLCVAALQNSVIKEGGLQLVGHVDLLRLTSIFKNKQKQTRPKGFFILAEIMFSFLHSHSRYTRHHPSAFAASR